jgi:hypothetical protein
MVDVKRYTETEGGEWLLWGKGAVDDGDLVADGFRCRPVNGALVHSLVTASGQRWDCINGWTGKVRHG